MLKNLIIKYQLFVKYMVSGCIAAAVDIAALYALTDFFGIWYLASSVLAFLIAFFAGFVLQKFWTFGCRDLSAIYKQAFLYLITGTISLTANSFLMYLLVERFSIHYILAQIMTGAIIAVFSFSFSYFITFRDVVRVRNNGSGKE
jgi:putative flippase GtrA